MVEGIASAEDRDKTRQNIAEDIQIPMQNI